MPGKLRSSCTNTHKCVSFIHSIALDYELYESINLMRKMNPHNPSEWYTAAQAAKFSNLSVAMLNYLCREGLVEPTCNCIRGRGVHRHYSFGDVVALRLIGKLSKMGISVGRLKKSMRRLRKLHPQITLTSLPASHVVTDGKDLYLCEPGEPLERILDGQFAFAFVIELSRLQLEVAEKISTAYSAKTVFRSAA